MKHIYNITGMTCQGCKASVEKHLSQVDGVTEVSVDLDKGKAKITMNSHISTDTFKKVLPEKYSITETIVFASNSGSNSSSTSNVSSSGVENSSSDSKSKLQKLKPLFLILGYIAIASVLLNKSDWNWREMMLDFMGLFFIVFSFFKMLDLKGFPQSFKMYDPLAKTIPAYGWIYPFMETALGLLFLMRIETDIALIATLVVLGITTIGVTKTLLDKKTIKCACLGTVLDLPMTEATFIENAIMIVMAIAMLLA